MDFSFLNFRHNQPNCPLVLQLLHICGVLLNREVDKGMCLAGKSAGFHHAKKKIVLVHLSVCETFGTELLTLPLWTQSPAGFHYSHLETKVNL